MALPGERETGVKHYRVRPASSKKGNAWKDSIRLANSHKPAQRPDTKREVLILLPAPI